MFIEGILPAARERLVTVRHDAPLMEAAKLLSHAQIDLVVVCDDENVLTGVIAQADVVRQIGHCAGGSCMMAVAAVMKREVTCCFPGDLLTDVWVTMRERGLAHVPIIDEHSRPLGVLHARDALQVLLDEVVNEELLLRDYVLGMGYR